MIRVIINSVVIFGTIAFFMGWGLSHAYPQ